MARPRTLPDADWLFNYLHNHLEDFNKHIAAHLANMQLPRGEDQVKEQLHKFAVDTALALDDRDYKRLKAAWRQKRWRMRASEKRAEYLENRLSKLQVKPRLKAKMPLGSWH